MKCNYISTLLTGSGSTASIACSGHSIIESWEVGRDHRRTSSSASCPNHGQPLDHTRCLRCGQVLRNSKDGGGRTSLGNPSHSLSCDTCGVAEFCPVMTSPLLWHGHIHALTHGHTLLVGKDFGLMRGFDGFPSAALLALAHWTPDPGLLPPLLWLSLHCVFTPCHGTSSLPPWGTAGWQLTLLLTAEEPLHMATSQIHYQILPMHATSEQIFTSAPIISQ